MRLQAAGKMVAFAALVALTAMGGCQAGDSGGGGVPSGDGPGTSGATARASAVTVTYYYLPG